jgi:hypothetical protein
MKKDFSAMDEDAVRQKKLIYMTEHPTEKLVFKLAIPSIISTMVASFYNMVDTFFVGRIGTSATAAVGVSFTILLLVQAIGYYFGQGSGNYISRKLGEKNSRMLAHGFRDFFTGFACARWGLPCLISSGRSQDCSVPPKPFSRMRRTISPASHRHPFMQLPHPEWSSFVCRATPSSA